MVESDLFVAIVTHGLETKDGCLIYTGMLRGVWTKDV